MEEEIKKLHSQLQEAKTSLETYSTMEQDSNALKAELQVIKEKLKKEEELRKERESKVMKDSGTNTPPLQSIVTAPPVTPIKPSEQVVDTEADVTPVKRAIKIPPLVLPGTPVKSVEPAEFQSPKRDEPLGIKDFAKISKTPVRTPTRLATKPISAPSPARVAISEPPQVSTPRKEEIVSSPTKRIDINSLTDINQLKELYEKQQEEMKKQESRHQLELKEARDKLESQEAEKRKLLEKLADASRVNTSLLRQIEGLQFEESPAWMLRKTAIKIIGNDSLGLKFLVDFINGKVLDSLKDKPELAYCNEFIPLPAFVALRVLLEPECTSLDPALLSHIVDSTNFMTKVCKWLYLC